MNELYWISRLDGISGVTLCCSIIAGVVAAIGVIGFIHFVKDIFENRES